MTENMQQQETAPEQVTEATEQEEQTMEITTEQPRVHGNTLKAARIAVAKKEISADSCRAVDTGEISLQEARALGRDTGPSGPIGPALKRVDKNDHTPTLTPCLCGCGTMVPRLFASGHI